MSKFLILNKLSVFLLLYIGSCLSIAVPIKPQELKAQELSQNANPEINVKPIPVKTIDRLRQDGEEGDTPEVPEPVEVDGLANVASIINGVLTGSISSIFKGSAGWIEEGEVREGVGGILDGFTSPLTKIFETGLNRTKEYFGITPPTTKAPPILMAQTTNLTAASTSNATLEASILTTSTAPSEVKNEATKSTTITTTKAPSKIPDDDEDEVDSLIDIES